MVSAFQSRQAERTALQTEIRDTSKRIEELFQRLNILIARQVVEGK